MMARIRNAVHATVPVSARRIGRKIVDRVTSLPVSALRRQAWAHSLRFAVRSRQAVFSDIYAAKIWGSSESGSGTGSELRATENIRFKLPEILRRTGARSLLDAPCGDWNWMQHVNLPVDRYHGFDIVPSVIAENRRRFSRPGVEFDVRDLTKDPLPQVDMVMCRDCLVHLSYSDIRAVLANLKRTKATYILVNTYPQAITNEDQFTGAKYRLLDMTLPPFNFPPPIESFPDGGDVDPNMMGLWKLQELPDLDALAPAKLDRSVTIQPHPPSVAPRLRAPPKRIGLFGFFGIGNFGNDGSLEAMLLFLRRACPQAEITCICPEPRSVKDTYKIPTVPFSSTGIPGNWFSIVDRLLLGVPRGIAAAIRTTKQARNLDVLIIPGTGALDDFGTGPRGWPIGLFTWCLAARLRSAKVLFVSIGAGPIAHPLSRWLMKSAARMAQYRSYRDTVSKDFMESIGFDTSGDPIYPDIAFKLPTPKISAPAFEVSQPLTVGVGVMAYYGWRGDTGQGARIYGSYLEKLSQFVLWLLDRDYRVRILMGETTDQMAVDDLLNVVALKQPDYPREHIVAEPAHSLHDLMRQIAQTQVVVATRFHNIVCALKLSKPAVSIGYAKKNDVLMAEMGVGDFCQHVERLDVDLLIEQFTRLVSDRPRYEQRMREVNEVYYQRLALQEQVLVDQVM